MKKTLIALAMLGAFAGTAVAQSNVTLYGIVDVNTQYVDPKAGGQSSTWGINSGHQSGSRWGVRGSEALGRGLNAIFTLEGGYNPDLGTMGQGLGQLNRNLCQNTTTNVITQGAPQTYYGSVPACPTGTVSAGTAVVSPANPRLFGRQVWAGLEGGFGTVVLGRLASLGSGTGSFDMFGFTDPFLTGFTGANLIFSVANALRYDNGILYRSPKWGPIQVGFEHSRNVIGTEIAGNGNNVHMTGGAISFGSGPFMGAVTYNTFNNPAAGASDQKNLQVGATFDIGFVKLHAGYADEQNQFFGNSVGITNGADATAWMGGVTVKLGAGSLLASYNYYDADAQLGEERDLRRWGIGYVHPLSRRTNLYASFADNDGRKTLNNVVDFRQYTIGVRHLF